MEYTTLAAEVKCLAPDDIEEMATSYFQKIYTSEQSIGDVVNMLKRFKSSANSRKNDIYACMIHDLFDKYCFFSKYPEKELSVMGILYARLIQHQLVSSITLGIALRYVLEALCEPLFYLLVQLVYQDLDLDHCPVMEQYKPIAEEKCFNLVWALEQFKECLHEWPQYCSHIFQIPHLKEGYQALVNEIEGALVYTSIPTPASGIAKITTKQ